MVTQNQILLYRRSVCTLLQTLRFLLYVDSGRTSYPTDASIAFRLGISPTALSSISRQCSSMSGVILQKLLFEVARLSDPGDFATSMVAFVKCFCPE